MPRRPYNWQPGIVAGKGFVLPSRTGCTLNYVEVYPAGLWIQMSVRLRGPLTIEQQRVINHQVDAYLRNIPSEAPQLIVDQDNSGRSVAELVTHEGHNNFWTLSFWAEHPVASSGLTIFFTWPEQGIELAFPVDGEEIERALGDATELWETSSMEYTTF